MENIEVNGGRIYNDIVRGFNNGDATYMGWRGDGIRRQNIYSIREPNNAINVV